MTAAETALTPGPKRAPTPRIRRSPHWRVATLTGATLVLIGGVAITMAASPEPATTPTPDVATQPDTSSDGSRMFRGPFMRGLGLGLADGFAGAAGERGGFAVGNITITAINGSSISLQTVDGWTRTITVTDQTQVTKDGDAIALSDLNVGDRIRFRQTVDDSGAYTVTAIAVVSPSVVGQVSAVGNDTITLSQRDGTSVTVHVDGSTTFTVGGETGKSLSDIEVGMIVGATGDLNGDGSLDASRVRAGSIWDGLGRGRGHNKWMNPDGAPPTGSPENSSTSAS